MILRELTVERYGGLSDLGPLRFGSGLTLITGPNESGKTTLMEAVRTVLFGYAPARYDRHPRAPWDQSPLSLKAIIEGEDQRIRVERRLGQEVSCELHRGEESLQIGNVPLPGIDLDPKHYAHLYALKQGDLPDLDEEVLRSLEDRLLFDQTAHLLRTPGELAGEAEATLHGIWRPHNRGKYALKTLREEKRVLLDRKRAILAEEKALRKDHRRLESLEKEREDLRVKIASEKERIAASRRALHRKEHLEEIRTLENRLNEAPSLEGISPTTYDHWIEGKEKLGEHQGRLLQLEAQLEDKRRAIDTLERTLPTAEERLRLATLTHERIRAIERLRIQREEVEATRNRWEEARQSEPHLRMEGLDDLSWPELRQAMVHHSELIRRVEEAEKHLAGHRAELPLRRLGWMGLGLAAVFSLVAYVLGGEVLWLVSTLVFSLSALFFHQRVYVPLGMRTRLAREQLGRLRAETQRRKQALDSQVGALGLRWDPADPPVDRLDFLFERRSRWLAAASSGGAYEESLAGLDEEIAQLSGGRSAEYLEEEGRRLETLKGDRTSLEAALARTSEEVEKVGREVSSLEQRLLAFDPDLTMAKEKIEHYVQLRSRLFFLKESYEEIAVEHFGYACYDTEMAIEEAQAQLEEMEARREKVVEEASGLRMRLDLASDQTPLPDLLSSIDAVDRQMAELEGEKEDLQLEIAMLRYIDEVYKHEHQPPILKLASDYLKKITQGRYQRLFFDAYQLVVERETGDRIPIDRGLSQGTIDQIFFAFRMAAMGHYDRRFGPLPVLLDDVFAHWDEERFTAFLPALEALAEKRQVLVMTHHRVQRERLAGHFDPLDEIKMR